MKRLISKIFRDHDDHVTLKGFPKKNAIFTKSVDHLLCKNGKFLPNQPVHSKTTYGDKITTIQNNYGGLYAGKKKQSPVDPKAMEFKKYIDSVKQLPSKDVARCYENVTDIDINKTLSTHNSLQNLNNFEPHIYNTPSLANDIELNLLSTKPCSETLEPLVQLFNDIQTSRNDQDIFPGPIAHSLIYFGRLPVPEKNDIFLAAYKYILNPHQYIFKDPSLTGLFRTKSVYNNIMMNKQITLIRHDVLKFFKVINKCQNISNELYGAPSHVYIPHKSYSIRLRDVFNDKHYDTLYTSLYATVKFIKNVSIDCSI
jgi:hypothetical protein